MVNKLIQSKYFWLILLSVSLIWTFLLYFRVVSFEFVNWDDNAYVFQNNDITELNRIALLKYFSTFYLGMYQPITILSFALEYHFFGLDASAFHAVNLILHLLNVCLVFFLIRSLTGNVFASFIVSLFFGIHPLHVESVAWISERKDVLYAFHFLLGLISYVYFLKTRKIRFWIFAIVLFILSLLSKSAAVTFPLVLLLIHFYHQKEGFRVWNSILSIWPFLLISLLFGILSLLSQNSFGNNDISQVDHLQINRLFIAGFAYFSYILHLFYPSVFSAVHPLPLLEGEILPFIYYLYGIFTFCVLFIALWYYMKGKRNKLYYDTVFGFLFFTFNIFLILYNPASKAVYADRYTYLAYIGLFFILYGLMKFLVENSGSLQKFIRLGAIVLFLGLSVFYSINASTFISNWKDSKSLWTKTIENEPSPIAYFSMAIVRKEQGDVDGAIHDYKKAISLNEHFFQAYTNIAAISIEKSDYAGALIYLNKVISLNSSFSEGYYNRGLVFSRLNKIPESIVEFTSAIDNNANYELAYISRANAYAALDSFDKAYNDVNKCLQMQPIDYHALTLRGYLLFKSNQLEDALIDLNTALKIKPDYSLAYNNRALIHMKMNNYLIALIDLNKAIKIDPDFTNAIFNRAKVYLKMNNADKACKDLYVAYHKGVTEAGLLIDENCR